MWPILLFISYNFISKKYTMQIRCTKYYLRDLFLQLYVFHRPKINYIRFFGTTMFCDSIIDVYHEIFIQSLGI